MEEEREGRREATEERKSRGRSVFIGNLSSLFTVSMVMGDMNEYQP